MEIDINIVAHDLLWRRMSIGKKQEYIKSWGALRSKIVEEEMTRLIADGYAVRHDDELELTEEGNALQTNDEPMSQDGVANEGVRREDVEALQKWRNNCRRTFRQEILNAGVMRFVARRTPQAAPQQALKKDPMEQLSKLKKMVEAGLITEEEFNRKKAEILARM